MKLLVIGHARHGKDTVCEMLRDKYGMSFTSSSAICNEHIIFPVLAPKYGYKTLEDCYNDRVNHRAEWFDLITEYNTPDKAKLGELIFASNDIYCGLRNKEEWAAIASEGLCDLTLWVDATDRLDVEDEASCTVHPVMANIYIDNNGTLEELESKVEDLWSALKTYGYVDE